MSTIKVKQSPNGSEFLETIPSIQLNQNFQQSLQEAFSKINDNFKKIISLPFLQGDHGNSIFEVEMRIGEGQDGAELKRAICQCIYGTDTPDDSQFGGNYFGGSWSDGTHTYDGTPIVFYRHKETDEQNDTYFYTAREFFLFIDRRVANLQVANPSDPDLVSAITDFRDLSCAVTIFAQAKADPSTGQPDLNDITFEAKLHTIVPTLYYDKYSKYWCWSVNGTKTGVIAQGVKGDAGASREIYVCIGHKGAVPSVQEDNGTVIVDQVIQPEAYRDMTAVEFAQHVNTGDLLVVWFKDESGSAAVSFWNNNPDEVDNCTFGTAKRHLEYNDQGQVANGYAYIDIGTSAGNRMDLATIMAETSLYRWLNDICNDEASTTDPSVNPAIRGLYIPNGKPFEGSKVHMLWSEIGASSPTASIGCVDSGARQLMGGTTLPTINGDTVTGWESSDTSALNLWYPTIRCHRGTFYRLMDNYAMSSGITPANLSDQSLRSFSDPSVMPSTYNLGRTDGKIASAFSLKGPDTDAVKDETIVASTGIIIKRSEKQDNPNDVPSVYIDHGKYGNIYVRGGKITAEGARLYIGRKNGDNAWYDPKTYFDAKYDGSDTAASGDGGSYTSAVENEIKLRRWEFGEPTDGSTAYMRNPGMKLVSSDIVDHGGMIIVSSDNAYKSVFIKDNKVMFDCKAHAELGTLTGIPEGSTQTVNNATAIHDRRPRYPQYMGIKIGGYNTIYNSVTLNSDSTGKVSSANGIIDNLRDPIALTPDENKAYAFMSGKSGYTAMLENWGTSDIRTVDPPYTISGYDDTTVTQVNGNWGLVTSYDCIWTKVGNVVDVKGKIFLNKASYTLAYPIGGGDPTLQVSTSSAQPLTYAELFRHLKKYGTRWAFPLPIVVDRASETDGAPEGSVKYTVSTGNVLDNPTGTSIVNRTNLSGPTPSDGRFPMNGSTSASEYYNNIFNGSAQFHFYGTKTETVGYNSTLDSVGTAPSGQQNYIGPNDSTGENLDMLNNVFTVTADIAKSPSYDDRFWCLSAIPNYDVLNYEGRVESAISRDRYDQISMNRSDGGPVKIVSFENGERTDDTAIATGSRYHQSHAILGLFGTPNRRIFEADSNNDSYDSRLPEKFYQAAGHLSNKKRADGYESAALATNAVGKPYCVTADDQRSYTDFASAITAPHLGEYIVSNYLQNLNSYKVSVNIGSYKIRYITFAFSYILDDDIEQGYSLDSGTNRYERINSNIRVDEDSWYIPKVSGQENHHHTSVSWAEKFAGATAMADAAQRTVSTDDLIASE